MLESDQTSLVWVCGEIWPEHLTWNATAVVEDRSSYPSVTLSTMELQSVPLLRRTRRIEARPRYDRGTQISTQKRFYNILFLGYNKKHARLIHSSSLRSHCQGLYFPRDSRH